MYVQYYVSTAQMRLLENCGRGALLDVFLRKVSHFSPDYRASQLGGTCTRVSGPRFCTTMRWAFSMDPNIGTEEFMINRYCDVFHLLELLNFFCRCPISQPSNHTAFLAYFNPPNASVSCNVNIAIATTFVTSITSLALPRGQIQANDILNALKSQLSLNTHEVKMRNITSLRHCTLSFSIGVL